MTVHLASLTSRRPDELTQEQTHVNTFSVRRVAVPAIAVLTVGLTLTACGDKNSSSPASSSGGGGGTINGGGATSQTTAQQTWRSNYQKQNGGTINYEEVGSGTGV